MQQPSQAPISAESDDVDHKNKLLALLDGARVNCGVKPEQSVDTSLPSIKTEPMDPPTALTSSKLSTIQSQLLQCTCNHSNQLTTPLDTHTPIYETFQALFANLEHSDNLPTTSMLNQTESVAIKPETSPTVLSSSITDLTGDTSQQIPRLQQLKPLEVPRNIQVQHKEKKDIVKRGRQLKQPRKNAVCSNYTVFLKKLALLTSDEYDDAELHGDFQHMIHVLIPSNATTALLERRGQPIQNINQQTGCTLSIREPDASPFKDNRVLRIYGKAKGISLAQRLVIAYIRAFRAQKRDPNYMDLSDEALPVALPVTSITKAMSVAVTAEKKNEMEITNPFHWMVQRDNVGKMMGKQGSTIASIRRDTGASIRIEDDVVPGTTERRVILSGYVESIAAAVEEIKSRSSGHPEVAVSVANDRHGQYFAIPYHTAGDLIGPQGSTIRNITERTGARLQIPSAEDLPLGSINRILHMQGTPKQAEHARRVIKAKLRDFLASSKSPKSLSLASTGLKGDKVTIKVVLPSRICGFMLDRRGKLIREISKKSGAHTYFLAAHDDGNRVCVFTGEMSCVLRAQRLVLQVIAGDAISSKRAAPPRKRKRSQRDKEDEAYDEVAEEDMKDEEPCFEDEVDEESYNDDEYEEAPRHPVRRKNVRRQPIRCPRHDYEEDEEDLSISDDTTKHEQRPRQSVRQRPVAIRSREYLEDENAVDDYSLDKNDRKESMSCDVPQSRPSMRPAVVRRQPVTRRQDDYDDDYEEDDDEHGYTGDSDGVNEDSIVRKQMVEQRPIGSRPNERRQPVVGRKVQMVASNRSPRERWPRMSPTDRRCTNGTSSVCPGSRSGSANMRQNVPRGGRGNGRPSTKRGRENGNKRRRQ